MIALLAKHINENDEHFEKLLKANQTLDEFYPYHVTYGLNTRIDNTVHCYALMLVFDEMYNYRDNTLSKEQLNFYITGEISKRDFEF